MKLIKVAAAVLNQTPLAWEQNKANILAAVETARADGARILCLPEMCISGYGCEDFFQARGTQETSLRVLQELLPATRGMVVSFGLPVLHNNGLFNAVALAADGRLLGFVAKRYLCGDGIHYEPRWFKPWPRSRQSHVLVDDGPGGFATTRVPIGDIYFDVGGVRIGCEICEDAWVADRPGSRLALRGVDLILNPSASHFAFEKIETRKRFVLEGSRAFGVAYVYANLLGNEAGRAIYDGGALIASGGRLIAAGPRFSFQDVLVTSAVIDISIGRMNQTRLASFEPTVDEGAEECVEADFAFPEIEPQAPAGPPPAWETSAQIKEEEFTRALTLGLFDYLRKSRSHGFVVSLSGGADSAAVACLAALLVEAAWAELGRDGVLARLAHVPGLREAQTPQQVVRRILTCVYQATEHSGPVTSDAAARVAEALGAEFLRFDVDALVKGYVGIVSQAIGRPLTWQTDDLALQNIQARVRAPGVWLLANIRNALLLSTSNRSEAAVGYCTMDGDTAGGLSPIAGIDKHFLRRWLRWMETAGPEGLHPIPALAQINAQAPTAELRPAASGQTDEGDLMPYELLDAIERAAIRDKQPPLAVFKLMRMRFAQYAPAQLVTWIERFFRLWARNQWKRERYAPSFHLDDENLDPKTWCRFPILSGGFERELAELRAAVRTT